MLKVILFIGIVQVKVRIIPDLFLEMQMNLMGYFLDYMNFI